ncbi:MAG: hypothetical protein A4E32_01432 [Methanomassiliicoccales archaeon PtaU1.Bin124]|nr:MAG: hypothetical protein A4E32_01432 [Methanomassiliicoccales archaeon PtaU1.Bin124]
MLAVAAIATFSIFYYLSRPGDLLAISAIIFSIIAVPFVVLRWLLSREPSPESSIIDDIGKNGDDKTMDVNNIGVHTYKGSDRFSMTDGDKMRRH